ncbi:MAG TPA: histidine kinase [Vicinamibacterales bacterium]|nr:histidine kinase [Vicinamibacterales bacterium]
MRDRQLGTLQWAVVAIGLVSAVAAATWLLDSRAAANVRWYVAIKNAVYWGAWSVLIPWVVRIALLIRKRRWPWVATLSAHAIAAATCATLHLTVLAGVDLLARVWLLGAEPLRAWHAVADSLLMTPRLIIEWELTMYAALAAFGYANAFSVELQQRAGAEAELKASLAEARLSALQRQLQPHFLFNTLHGVSSLIRRDASAAEQMIERLGRLLRTAINTGATFETSLAEDLDALNDYLAIEAVQMRERLRVTFDIAANTLGAAVPSLLLQPLVENSVRHGLQPRARGGGIHVAAHRAGDRLHIEIVDDGVGLNPDATEGVGLLNTRSRLAQLYGSRQSFTVAARNTGGVRVDVTLPFRLREES